jgi:hypothetical protein
MRALEQPLLAVQQLSSGIRTLRYRPLLPEDFQPLKVSLGEAGTAAHAADIHAVLL